MQDGRHARRSRRSVRRISVALLIFAIGALALLSGISPAPRASSSLLQMAAAEPAARLGVIVQQTGQDVDLTGWVTRAGGTITRNLSIINAFSAKVPGQAIAQLAVTPGVRWISLDSQVDKSGCSNCNQPAVESANNYPSEIHATDLWAGFPQLQGQGITIAVVDSGIGNAPDLGKGLYQDSRVIERVRLKGKPKGWSDHYGHGTFVAGVIAGDGQQSGGKYRGVAQGANLVSVQVTDDDGMGMTSDVVAGLQWVLENKDRLNIRVVNLSLNSSVAESYNVDPLDAAVEILWFNKIVVVASVGNTGPAGELYAPANDPFVITVGAVNDQGTPNTADDVLASYSGFATTGDGFVKPDLVAPGSNIVSLLASGGSTLARAHRDHIVDQSYFRMSGTSISAAIVSGAAALLLQSKSDLSPDQVKYRLTSTARPFGAGAGAGYLDINAAVHSTTLRTANTGTPVSKLLWTGSNPPPWNSVNWNSVSWTSVSWTSVSWTSVSWTSVSWTSDYWGN